MQLEATGERVIEEHYLSSPERYLIYLFHRATYNFCLPHTAGKKVLDYGCGSGYGTHALAASCAHIIGIDISADAIAYAAAHYQAPNLNYLRIERAEISPLPFADRSFDTVLSFQVIEHLRDVKPYLQEIRRVLKPGGSFICATPDRSTRLLPLQKPWNEWHVHEYDAAGFRQALANSFEDIEILKMGGTAAVLARELKRTRLTRWLTLPCTLPFMPEVLRVAGLRLLKKLSADKSIPAAATKPDFGFDENDLFISADAEPSVNLIALARKS